MEALRRRWHCGRFRRTHQNVENFLYQAGLGPAMSRYLDSRFGWSSGGWGVGACIFLVASSLTVLILSSRRTTSFAAYRGESNRRDLGIFGWNLSSISRFELPVRPRFVGRTTLSILSPPSKLGGCGQAKLVVFLRYPVCRSEWLKCWVHWKFFFLPYRINPGITSVCCR